MAATFKDCCAEQLGGVSTPVQNINDTRLLLLSISAWKAEQHIAYYVCRFHAELLQKNVGRKNRIIVGKTSILVGEG